MKVSLPTASRTRPSLPTAIFSIVSLAAASLFFPSGSMAQEIAGQVVADEFSPIAGLPAEPIQGFSTMGQPALNHNLLSAKPRGATPTMQAIPLAKNALGTTIRYQNEPGSKRLDWVSSEFCHQKLIFEEPELERHGRAKSGRWQPAVSAAKFFARGAIFPVQQSWR